MNFTKIILGTLHAEGFSPYGRINAVFTILCFGVAILFEGDLFVLLNNILIAASDYFNKTHQPLEKIAHAHWLPVVLWNIALFVVCLGICASVEVWKQKHDIKA